MGSKFIEHLNREVNKTTINSQINIINQNRQESSIVQNIQQDIQGDIQCGEFTLSNEAKENTSSLSLANGIQRDELAETISDAIVNTTDDGLSEAERVPVNNSTAADVIKRVVNESITEQKINAKQSFENCVSQTTNINQTIYFRIGPTAKLIVGGTCAFTNTTSVQYTSQVTTDGAMIPILSNPDVQQALKAWDDYDKANNKSSLSPGEIAGIVLGCVVLLIIIVIICIYVPKHIQKNNEKNNEQTAYSSLSSSSSSSTSSTS